MSGTQDRHFPLSLILWPLVCAALCTSAAFSSLGRPPSSVLYARDRRWQWWFTAPVLHAPFKTRGNQLVSDSQSQIPMRDKLSQGNRVPQNKLGTQTYLWWGRGHFSGTRGQWAGQTHLQSVTYSSIKCKGASSSCEVHRNRQDKSHIFKPIISEEN